MVLKFEKHHHLRLPHLLHSPDMSPCDFWLFGMLKRILEDCELHSNDELEGAIALAWNNFTFDEQQGVFHNLMNGLARVIKNCGEDSLE
jgi:hypothetical protein